MKNKQNWNNLGEVTLRHYRGDIFKFSSLRECLELKPWKTFNHEISRDWDLKKINNYGFTYQKRKFVHLVSLKPKKFEVRWGYDYFKGDAWLLRDELGMIIPHWRIDYELDQIGSEYYRFGVKGYALGEKYFRKGPLLYRWFKPTMGRKGTKYSAGRREHSQQERSYLDFFDYDEDLLELKVVKKEPMDWDRVSGGKLAANWKRYRRTQYKVVNM